MNSILIIKIMIVRMRRQVFDRIGDWKYQISADLNS